MPELANWEARSEGDALSELTKRRVTTSFGFSSIQLLIAESQSLSRPASSRSQEVWHKCHALFEL